jgi:hypothetical protein
MPEGIDQNNVKDAAEVVSASFGLDAMGPRPSDVRAAVKTLEVALEQDPIKTTAIQSEVRAKLSPIDPQSK